MTNYLLKFIIFNLFFVYQVHGEKFRFDHYSKKDGLSNKSVYCVIQDSNGYLWFGTREGLNRFDGYEFKVYQHIPFSDNSLSDSYITSIVEDDSLNLWIGTANGGLNMFNSASGEFVHFLENDTSQNSISNNGVWSLCCDSDNYIWIGTENGLDKLDPKTGSIISILNNTYIISLYEDKNGFIWVGTGNGVYKLNRTDNSMEMFSKNEGSDISLADNRVWTTYQDNMNNFWFGTQNGLSSYSPTKKIFKNYFTDSQNMNGANFIVPIFHDSKNNLWAGSIGGGIFLFQDGDFQNISFNQYDQNIIWDIYEDRSGCVWFCTLNGILKLNYDKQKFQLIDKENNKISDNTVLTIFEDSRKNIWVGASKGGISVLDGDARVISRYNSTNVLLSDQVNSIYEDAENNFWLGTGNGITIINSNGDILKKYNHDPNNANSLSNSRISSIMQDDFGDIWIGTYEGLNKIEKGQNKFQRFMFVPGDMNTLRNDIITTIYKDIGGILWIGTQGGGLAKVDPATGSITNFLYSKNDTSSISHNYVRVIFEDSKGRFWVGTFSGLNLFNKKSETFTYYSMKHGLSNNIISGICEDRSGNLWISTNNGINKFNYEENKFENYFEIDGLQDDEFNSGAFLTTTDFELLFGGNKGITKFNPDSLSNNQFIPQVIVKSVRKIDETIELNVIGSVDKSIYIPHDKNFIEIEFISFDYKNPVKNKYSYKLEGYDKEYITVSNNNRAAYMNLPEGEYVFSVKGSSSSGKWNNEQASFKIFVIPPFYKTWWFISIFVLLILSVSTSLIYLKVKSIVSLEKLRTNIAADLHDSIGTNLTEIIMTSDLLLHSSAKNPSDFNSKLNQISLSARSVMENMSDIVWLIRSKGEGTLIEIFNRLQENFSNLLSMKDITFSISNYDDASKEKISIEKKRQLYLILKESINNSVKHSGCKNIRLVFRKEGRSKKLVLSDDGIGFDPENIEEGNGLGNIKKRIENIEGSYTLSSVPGKGTELKLNFD